MIFHLPSQQQFWLAEQEMKDVLFFSVGSGVLICRCLRAMSQEGSCAVG